MSSTPAPLLPFQRPPLATPHLGEAIRAQLGQELENYLAPVVAYCDAQPHQEHLTQAEFRHSVELRQAIDALLRYDAQTEQLLAYYRQALAAAQQLATTRLPSLEQALAQPTPPTSPRPYVEPR
jgi:hypothetical protein